MFLVPLRFVEWGNQVSEMSNDQVLGVSTVATKSVVLPNAIVAPKKSLLEAPYDQIEAGCSQKAGLLKKLDMGNLTQEEVDMVVTKLDDISKTCK